MDRFVEYLNELYYSVKNNVHDKNYNPHFSEFNKRYALINKMSVIKAPNGSIVTKQSPGESLDNLEERTAHMHPVYASDSKGKFRLGEEIDSIYQDFINSKEGSEFIKYLKNNGNGTSRTGTIDDIFILNAGKGLVAATMPDAVRKNLIINQDYISEFVNEASDATGLSRRQIVEGIIAHELRHIYGQTSSERKGAEHKVEYNNDIGLVNIYTDLAKKDIDNSDTYLAKAKFFTIRYGGKYRKNMDEIISTAEKEVSKMYEQPRELYRNAA